MADSLTHSHLKIITASSLEISRAIGARELHLAVGASTGELRDGITEYPLIQDPFILVAPRGFFKDPANETDLMNRLPFLRYEREQLISRQIEAHLQRNKLEYEERFEIGSHLALMAMVARRIGWTITTPLGYMRAVRFHDQLDVFPLPIGSCARTISMFAASDWADRVPRDVATTVLRLAQTQAIDPAVSRLPWLAGNFRTMDI